VSLHGREREEQLGEGASSTSRERGAPLGPRGARNRGGGEERESSQLGPDFGRDRFAHVHEPTLPRSPFCFFSSSYRLDSTRLLASSAPPSLRALLLVHPALLAPQAQAPAGAILAERLPDSSDGRSIGTRAVAQDGDEESATPAPRSSGPARLEDRQEARGVAASGPRVSAAQLPELFAQQRFIGRFFRPLCIYCCGSVRACFCVAGSRVRASDPLGGGTWAHCLGAPGTWGPVIRGDE
jgi:hypothetical protein